MSSRTGPETILLTLHITHIINVFFVFAKGMIDSAPATSAPVEVLSHSLLLGSSEDAGSAVVVFGAGSVLPAELRGVAALSAEGSEEGFLRIFAASNEVGSSPIAIGDLVFARGTGGAASVAISVSVSTEGSVSLRVFASGDEAMENPVASLDIPSPSN